jgi:hypothetical protein
LEVLVEVRRGIRDNFFEFLEKVGADSGRAPVREISEIGDCRRSSRSRGRRHSDGGGGEKVKFKSTSEVYLV